MNESDTHLNPPVSRGISRRTLAAGAAWAVPAVAVAAAAPAYAAVSLRKDPGINGWVLNSPESRWGSCNWYLTVNSNPTGGGATPDGAPFGLYVYDVDLTATITDARITYWIIGNQAATWETRSGHSSCWVGPVRGNPQTKADGLTYTPYTWTYDCPIDAGNQSTAPDGESRVWLGHFHVRASFTQPSDRCNDITYWTQRHITIDGEVFTFERRNGTRGTYSPLQRSAPEREQNPQLMELETAAAEAEALAQQAASAQEAADLEAAAALKAAEADPSDEALAQAAEEAEAAAMNAAEARETADQRAAEAREAVEVDRSEASAEPTAVEPQPS